MKFHDYKIYKAFYHTGKKRTLKSGRQVLELKTKLFYCFNIKIAKYQAKKEFGKKLIIVEWTGK